MARVQIPVLLLVTLVAAAGLSRVFRALRSPWRCAPIALGLLASAVPSAYTLYAPTNEAQEEALIQEALRALPRGRYTLVRQGHEDANDEASRHTHLHFPDYLVKAPRGSGTVRSVAEWSRHTDWTAPAYFFAGFRCYARFRYQGVAAPRGDNLQPACAQMRREFQLTPVLEREAPNHGDVWLEYYGTAKTLRVGLYRISPPGKSS